MRSILLVFLGIFIGSWLSWPGILFSKNWECFIKIISSSTNQKIPLKALLAVPPNYLIKTKNKNIASKIRIVSDACFR